MTIEQIMAAYLMRPNPSLPIRAGSVEKLRSRLEVVRFLATKTDRQLALAAITASTYHDLGLAVETAGIVGSGRRHALDEGGHLWDGIRAVAAYWGQVHPVPAHLVRRAFPATYAVIAGSSPITLEDATSLLISGEAVIIPPPPPPEEVGSPSTA